MSDGLRKLQDHGSFLWKLADFKPENMEHGDRVRLREISRFISDFVEAQRAADPAAEIAGLRAENERLRGMAKAAPLEANKRYERPEDMSPDGKLRLIQQEDGDVILAIAGESFSASVEFCTSGGKSPATRKALVALAQTIRQENIDNPHYRSEET